MTAVTAILFLLISGCPVTLIPGVTESAFIGVLITELSDSEDILWNTMLMKQC